MSDPSQPDGTNPDVTGNEANQGQPTEAGSNEPLKAQAYVDPSIAAEAAAEAQLTGLEAENADLKDKYIRAHAEMENLRRRTEREKADTSKYAISKFAGDMLAVADNLQRALAAFSDAGVEADETTKALIEGVELTDSDLRKTLERHGVRKIDALGEIFDPNFHQAVMEEENKDIAAGTVIRVFQEGYQIGERTLRPTMVVVARGGFKPIKDADASPAGPAANDDAPPAPNDAEPEIPDDPKPA